MCDDGYDGEDCSTVTNKDYMIGYIIDNFESNEIDSKSWMRVTGGTVKDTCTSEPISKYMTNYFILVTPCIYRRYLFAF